MVLKQIEHFLESRKILSVPILIWIVFLVIILLRMETAGLTITEVVDDILNWAMGSLVIIILITVTTGIPIAHGALRYIKYGRF